MTAPGRDGGTQFHVHGDADQPDADRRGHGPRAADAEGNDGAEERRRHVEIVRAQDLQAVVDHRHQRAAHRPGARQRADREQDEDRADTGRDARDRRLAQLLGRVAGPSPDDQRDHRCQDQGHLVRPLRARVAEQVERQSRPARSARRSGSPPPSSSVAGSPQASWRSLLLCLCQEAATWRRPASATAASAVASRARRRDQSPHSRRMRRSARSKSASVVAVSSCCLAASQALPPSAWVRARPAGSAPVRAGPQVHSAPRARAGCC